MDVHLFILAGNQSGSTLLHNLFAQCPSAVTLNPDLSQTTEGFQWVKDSMPNIELNDQSYVWTEMIESIQDPRNYNWDNVKKTWNDMWRRHKNYDNRDRLFVQKSPSDVGRASLIEDSFENAWFACLVRNPYVVAEGVARRRGDCDIRRAARHSIKMLKLQKENIQRVSNLIAWRYEDIQAIPTVIEKLINESIPLVDGFSFNREFYASSIDGYKRSAFGDFNARQLKNVDERSLRIMNEEFEPYADVIKFFNYDRIYDGQRDTSVPA